MKRVRELHGLVLRGAGLDNRENDLHLLLASLHHAHGQSPLVRCVKNIVRRESVQLQLVHDEEVNRFLRLVRGSGLELDVELASVVLRVGDYFVVLEFAIEHILRQVAIVGHVLV